MKLLILGGTRFLGRHIVDVALDRGHDVTVFNRGRTTLASRPTSRHSPATATAASAPCAGASGTPSWIRAATFRA